MKLDTKFQITKKKEIASLLSYSLTVFLPGLPMKIACPYLFLFLSSPRAKKSFLVIKLPSYAREMAQLGKALAAKPNNLGFIPTTHRVKEKTYP